MKPFLFSLLLILFPSMVFALAGLGEKIREYEYSEEVYLASHNPTDECNQGSFCLYIKSEKNFASLGSIEQRPLDKVSLPVASKIFIAKVNGGDVWIVYDLARKKIIYDNLSYSESQRYWFSLENRAPDFVTTENIMVKIPELFNSKLNNIMLSDSFFWILVCLGWVFIILVIRFIFRSMRKIRV